MVNLLLEEAPPSTLPGFSYNEKTIEDLFLKDFLEENPYDSEDDDSPVEEWKQEETPRDEKAEPTMVEESKESLQLYPEERMELANPEAVNWF